MSSLLVSVHDVSPHTIKPTRRWLEHLDQRGLRSTILVIAGPWQGIDTAAGSDELGQLLQERAARGDEISYHGWTHRASRIGPLWRRVIGHAVTRGASEFWALDMPEVTRRLQASEAVLAELGVTARGLTPPGWMPSLASLEAARHCGLRYVTSTRAVHDLHTNRRHRIPAFCQRPGSMLSEIGRTVVERGVRMRVTRNRPVRIGLHPADLDYADLRASSLRAIDDSLDGGSEAMTYLSFLESGQ